MTEWDKLITDYEAALADNETLRQLLADIIVGFSDDLTPKIKARIYAVLNEKKP